MDDETKSLGTTERLLRCGMCGKCVECSSEELMSYMRQGWPKCCGETMELFIKAVLPDGATS
jgi:hypothetical protein